MKLYYRILWIENERDWVESIEDLIQVHLESIGFVYERTLIGKEDTGIDYGFYDLILMDLNLADQPNGAELISKIRDLGVYTDVVFYSASGIDVLRAKGREKELEGVYYSGRTPDSAFIKRVSSVIDSTIKKVQDLANLRGLVMAEVSELDGKMEDVINKYYIQNMNENLNKVFYDHIVKKHEERLKSGLEGCGKKEMLCYHKWTKMQIRDILPFMEASQMAKAINYIIPSDLYTPVRANFFEDYKTEIIEIRNELAHCASKIEDGKEILITRKGDRVFNDEDIKKIRKDIMKYSDIFAKLLLK